ncbi:MAG: gfo/Idh/MocA family oxidoreductase, partial [Verrucomicrobiales bacterium]
WQAEWNVFLESIRKDKPQNETKRAIYSNFASIMGRAAVHQGQVVTWDQMFASNFQFVPNVDELTFDSPAPVQADADGAYPVPRPGEWTEV